MKRILGLCIMGLAVLALASCTEKKPNTIIIAKKKPAVTKVQQTRKMGDYSQTRKTEWVGNKYTIETALKADPSLPLASDGYTHYYDNKVTMRIIRADGTDFFKKTFDKSYFKSYVDNSYYKNGALLGIIFVKAEGKHLVFAASVGNPDKSSDEYVPLVLKIDNFGNIAVSKDTKLDMEPEIYEDEEDGV
ncbi:MAG: DUF4738 domain-containing protein [Prevotella sp.]|jgi:hypothetical protein